MSHDRFRFGLVAAAFLVSIAFFIWLPEIVGRRAPMPVLDFARITICFTLPVATLIIVLIFRSLTRRDPFRGNYERFRKTYEISLDLAIALAFGTHLLLLSLLTFRRQFFGRWISDVPTCLVGLVLVVAGNVLPRLRPNYAIGIRTRWTLADESVWMKTHRAGGYVLVVFGLVLIAWTFIDFQGIGWVLGPGAILTVAGLPVLSYVIWKRRHPAAGTPPASPLDNKETPS
jgi:uncharacterized membrane protein